MSLVSIIVPYYKKREFISRCLKSIYHQSYKNYEIILIYDDKDTSDYKYLLSFKKTYRKLIIIKNTQKRGAGSARNFGIKHAKGNYIAFLDSDDQWHKDKLNIQINLMIKNNWSISHTSYKIIDEKKVVIHTRKAKDLDFNKLIRSCDIGLSSVVLKRNILNKKLSFPDLTTKEDYVLWLKVSKLGFIIHGINKDLMKWQKSSNSLSSNSIRKLLDGYSVYRKYIGYSIFRSLYSLLILSLNFIIKNNP